MDMHPAWVWMILAALFIVVEIFTAGFFLLWFGIGAAVAGVLALSGIDTIWQILAFVVVSLLLFFSTRTFVRRFTRPQPAGIGADRYAGKQGVVLEEINALRNSGRVQLGSEEWRAESEVDGDTISAGSLVTVVRLNGTKLVVSREKEERK